MSQVSGHAARRVEQVARSRGPGFGCRRGDIASAGGGGAGGRGGRQAGGSDLPARGRRARPHHHGQESRGADDLPPQHGTPAGGGGDGALPQVQCGIGPPTDEGFFYDFVVPRPFVPEDLDAIEKKMRELAQADFRFERQMWPRDEARRFFGARGEPLKVQLIDEKTEGQAEVSVLHHQGPRHLRGLLRRPARAVERPVERLQAADDVERLLEGRRPQPADAAGLRHRVLLREGAAGAPASGSRKPRRATTARSASDQKLFMFHPWAPGATFWLPKGTIIYNTLASYMREVLVPGRLHRGEGADRLQQGAVGDVRPLVALPPEHVPRWNTRRPRASRWALKAMNCPGHMLMYRAARSAATGTCPSATTSRRRCTGTRRRGCCRA